VRHIALGTGDGGFTVSYRLDLEQNPAYTLVAADFDGDGRVDLGTGVLRSHLRVYPGNGDGTLGAPTEYAIGSDLVLATDYDADGRVDVLARQQAGMLALVRNITP